mmetsp:Transcript_59484/g.130591  ORF Transcript_59484/g.130591 Transcript_59484/m.130591 type:complete len:319 (+) Transcript_59484:128-1084(+)
MTLAHPSISEHLASFLESAGGPLPNRYGPLASELGLAAEEWLSRREEPAWRAVSNSRERLLHEVEDALVPLQAVLDDLFATSDPKIAVNASIEDEREGEHCDEDGAKGAEPIWAVDLCAGKGFIALALLHLAGTWPRLKKRLAGVAVVEKRALMLDHLHEASKAVQVPFVELSRENIHDEAFPGRLLCSLSSSSSCDSSSNSKTNTNCSNNNSSNSLASPPNGPSVHVGLIAVHLCGRLSARAVEIFNQLGTHCRFLFLAPCCMPSGVPPRRGQPTVLVETDEAEEQELRLLTEKQLRKYRWQKNSGLLLEVRRKRAQ